MKQYHLYFLFAFLILNFSSVFSQSFKKDMQAEYEKEAKVYFESLEAFAEKDFLTI
ncbi:MAG: hypothetical protein ABIA04_12130 [Pseudomonadota bacterium]